MRLITLSGPPSAGKTSAAIKAARILQAEGHKVCAVKFDCLATFDGAAYEKNGIPVRTGLARNVCPDHYFVSNIQRCLEWSRSVGADIMISESAGLCNRCSPHIGGVLGICLLDCLMGVRAPGKMGAVLSRADVVVVSKSDLISPAERDVFLLRVRQVAPTAQLLLVNGITGQGTRELAALLAKAPETESLEGLRLRYPSPAAVCSFCLGRTQLNTVQQVGNLHRIKLD